MGNERKFWGSVDEAEALVIGNIGNKGTPLTQWHSTKLRDAGLRPH